MDSELTGDSARDCPEASEVDLGAAERNKGLLPEEALTPCEVPEWVDFIEGERVVVQRFQMGPKVGIIDVISDDALVFWVSLDNGEGRIMVNAQESVRVWQFS
jgi:hypothetical protein